MIRLWSRLEWHGGLCEHSALLIGDCKEVLIHRCADDVLLITAEPYLAKP